MATDLEDAADLEVFGETRKEAEAAYLGALSRIVDLSTLATSWHGFDFQVEAPSTELHVLSQRVVDLEFEIRDRFGMHIRTYLIPT